MSLLVCSVWRSPCSGSLAWETGRVVTYLYHKVAVFMHCLVSITFLHSLSAVSKVGGGALLVP
jgi:hypothetical protein